MKVFSREQRFSVCIEYLKIYLAESKDLVFVKALSTCEGVF